MIFPVWVMPELQRHMKGVKFFRIIRADYGSETTAAVEHITGRKLISFVQFVKDHTEAFR